VTDTVWSSEEVKGIALRRRWSHRPVRLLDRARGSEMPVQAWIEEGTSSGQGLHRRGHWIDDKGLKQQG